MMELANLVFDQVQEVVSDILELDEANSSLKDTLKPLPFIEVDHIKNSSNKICFPKVQDCPKDQGHCECCKKFEEKEKAPRKNAARGGSFQCDVCAYTTHYYKNLTGIKKHKATHENNICAQCKFETVSKLEMKLHVNRTHKQKWSRNDQPKTNFCDKCGYKTNRKGNLLKHIQTVHEGIRINCDHCEKKFSQHSDLNRHIGADHGQMIDPVLKCDLCTFTSIHRGVFTNHLKKHGC